MAYLPNPGHVPPETEIWEDVETSGVVARSLVGHRPVHVRLWGDPARGVAGWDTKRAGQAPWPAKGGRQIDTDWRISKPPHPYQIKEFEVA